MKDVKFGRQQWGKPTPAKIGFIVMLVSAIAGGLQLWMGTASYIPTKISEILQSILGLIIMLANILRPFFGVPVDSKTVPADKVTEIETDPKP